MRYRFAVTLHERVAPVAADDVTWYASCDATSAKAAQKKVVDTFFGSSFVLVDIKEV